MWSRQCASQNGTTFGVWLSVRHTRACRFDERMVKRQRFPQQRQQPAHAPLDRHAAIRAPVRSNDGLPRETPICRGNTTESTEDFAVLPESRGYARKLGHIPSQFYWPERAS